MNIKTLERNPKTWQKQKAFGTKSKDLHFL